jgi:lipopolysaccharide/colanic/teichoic acid biosynthesis glycosyltransferase
MSAPSVHPPAATPARIGVARRLLDIVVSLTALVALLPLLLFLAALVRCTSRGPALFRQVRVGAAGRPFVLLKYRSMTTAVSGGPQVTSAADARVTGVGRFLRRTSLDELPQLFNVLRGEMSLVGPRPLLMEYLPLYTPRQSRRHDVRPGITGWAQISGRNAIGWDEKFALDVWYVEHRTFWLDIRILISTIGRVLARHGITEEGQATVQPFRGSSQ